jgi:type I restriction enzyme R subunit
VVQGALAGDSETTLATAWRETSNQAVAASIMGYIRHEALDDAPTPVAAAHRQPNEGDHDRGSRSARRRPAVFKREGGGWPRLKRVSSGELDGVLQQFQREMWAA